MNDDLTFSRYVKDFDFHLATSTVTFSDEVVAEEFEKELQKCDKCDISRTSIIKDRYKGEYIVKFSGGCHILKKEMIEEKLRKKINLEKYISIIKKILITKQSLEVNDSREYIEILNEINGGTK